MGKPQNEKDEEESEGLLETFKLSNIVAIIRKYLKTDSSALTYRELFKYADKKALILTAIGWIFALGFSIVWPLVMIVYGENTDDFISDRFCQILDYTNISDICPPEVDESNFNELIFKCNLTSLNITLPEVDLLKPISRNSLYFTLIGIASFITAGIELAALSAASEHIVLNLRRNVIRAVMANPIEWFDVHDAGMVNSYLVENVNKFKSGVGDKIGMIIQTAATTIAIIIIAFVKSWKLSLVMIAVSPPLILSATLSTLVTFSSTKKESKSYAKAGSVAQQTIRNIRTVQAFNGQKILSEKYATHLKAAKSQGIKKSAFTSLMQASLWFVVFSTYAIGFWYGAKLIKLGELTIGGLLIVFFSILTAVFNIGGTIPHFGAVSEARASGKALYEIIDSPTEENAEKAKYEEYLKTEVKVRESSVTDFNESIHFDNVSFAYPTRKEITVLKDMNLTIPKGKVTALVGESGCGKSTVVQLLLRYYQPLNGSIKLGSKDIRELALESYRSFIGLVSQEPVLFSATIADNIRMAKKDATDEEIKAACEVANATEFIDMLPDKYNTFVGESGSTLSGGQRQRIAIARAIINNPKILLLDEATSALDAESERSVQKALESASKGRTTVIIAHRLSTIRNADLIVAIDNGRAAEQGTHDELMLIDGIYNKLVKAYSTGTEKKPERARLHSKRGTFSDKTAVASEKGSIKEDEPKEAEAEEKQITRQAIKEVFILNKPEVPHMIVGCICAAIFGTLQTLFQIYMARILLVFAHCNADERQRRVDLYSLLFFIFGLCSLISQFGAGLAFGISGENLTKRIRERLFKAILRQEIGYFDLEENSVGSVCTMLSTEAASVQGATGTRLGVVVSTFAILGTGTVVAFVFGWQLCLVIIAFIPVLIISGFVQMKIMGGFDVKDKKLLETAGKIATEATANIRTVKQLNAHRHFIELYEKIVEDTYSKNFKKSIFAGLIFGFSQGIVFFALATGYYAGANFIVKGLMSTEDMMFVFGCLMFAAMGVGQIQAMAPDQGKATAAAVKVHKVLSRKPEIDSMSTDGIEIDHFNGDIKFQNVDFEYPTREGVPVLRSMNIHIPSSRSIALVGSSGSGKSTVLQLLERYYDPVNGNILIDGHNLRDLNIKSYRKKLGFVGQEPVLFDWSIAENIAFGDTDRQVTIEEIRAAAQTCNIDSFVSELPDGYDTRVGAKGSLISGGQKQRICIARAIIRNPKLLLLDEATSALDTESEKMVQAALEEAQKGRGSISIAHRLRTIEDCDDIFVMDKGKITESGTHQELISKESLYSELYKLSTI